MEDIGPRSAFFQSSEMSLNYTHFLYLAAGAGKGMERRWMLLFGDFFSWCQKSQVEKAWVLCIVCLKDNLRVRDNVERS